MTIALTVVLWMYLVVGIVVNTLALWMMWRRYQARGREMQALENSLIVLQQAQGGHIHTSKYGTCACGEPPKDMN